MAPARPFRFGVAAPDFPSREAVIAYARKVEALGYSTLVSSDHMFFGGMAPLLALMVAAEATTTLRLATHVLNNDFHNPTMLAQEIATFDLLSQGRFEFGIGAGWLVLDYTAGGVPFEAAATRIRRLEEAVPLLKRLLQEAPVTFAGDYYTLQELSLRTKPQQRPHPPLYIGGGGKRILTLAGREAMIVGLDWKGTRAGGKDYASTTADALVQKIEWVRQAAGERFDALELHMLFNTVTVTDDRRRGASQELAWLAQFGELLLNPDPREEAILASPYFLVGTVDQIVEDLRERRERFGVSYVTVGADAVDLFSPVVARLAGS